MPSADHQGSCSDLGEKQRTCHCTCCDSAIPVLVYQKGSEKYACCKGWSTEGQLARASGCVPETLHNIRTIHCLQKEKYMTERYDRYIGESYRAVERSNFCDAIYSPVILILNAVVVAVVMLLSASGNAQVLMLFGMSAGTAVAVINYISQIFGPVGKSWHGDSDDPVSNSWCAQDQ